MGITVKKTAYNVGKNESVIYRRWLYFIGKVNINVPVIRQKRYEMKTEKTHNQLKKKVMRAADDNYVTEGNQMVKNVVKTGSGDSAGSEEME